MAVPPEPNEQNCYCVDHINLLIDSFRYYTSKDLVDPALDRVEAAKELFNAPFVLVSHDTAADPIFTYGNKTALALFEMTWPEFTALPSKQSAEPPNREERAALLSAVSTQGFIENYSGVRISKSGRRFIIQEVTVWNLRDRQGQYQGQAAVYSSWQYL